mmetsp:Transcript_16279/g.23847  ORF Transcript_16279/g.23847 Transcript_16279/m.23847 type:complete len:97 (+) Transcript_16279:57-347(+)
MKLGLMRKIVVFQSVLMVKLIEIDGTHIVPNQKQVAAFHRSVMNDKRSRLKTDVTTMNLFSSEETGHDPPKSGKLTQTKPFRLHVSLQKMSSWHKN